MPSQQGYSAFLATGFFHWQRAFARWTRCTRYIIRNRPHLSSCRREQAHPDLTYVQVDELCVFVRDVTPEISADEAVPPTQSESASATSHVSGGGGGVGTIHHYRQFRVSASNVKCFRGVRVGTIHHFLCSQYHHAEIRCAASRVLGARRHESPLLTVQSVSYHYEYHTYDVLRVLPPFSGECVRIVNTSAVYV